MVLKLGHFRKQVTNTWKILMYDAGEGSNRSVRPIIYNMKYYKQSKRKGTS
jgi:hypothetical protein